MHMIRTETVCEGVCNAQMVIGRECRSKERSLGQLTWYLSHQYCDLNTMLK